MKYLLNVDWLEFRASTEINLNNFLSKGIYKFSNGLSLERVKDYGYLKRSYSFCFKMLYKNEDVGFFYSKVLNLGLSPGFNTLLKIDNKVFYKGNIAMILKTLLEALGLINTKIKRLDICYDTDVNVLSRFKTLYEDEPSITFRFGKNISVTGTGKKNDVVYIGSITGKKCIAIYNKTIEINKKSHKEYIREVHRKVFGYKPLIYRVELRIKERTLEIKDIDIMSINKSEYLETIFNTYFDNLVQFSDINTKEKIEFIKLDNSGEKLIRVKRIKSDGGNQIKGIINFLDKESKSKEFRGIIKACNQVRSALLKKHGLETWYKVRNNGLMN